MGKTFLFLLLAFNRVAPHNSPESAAGYEIRPHSLVQENDKKEVTYSLWHHGDSSFEWLIKGAQKKVTFTGFFQPKNQPPLFTVTEVKINCIPFSIDTYVPIFADLLSRPVFFSGYRYGDKEKSD